MSRSRSGSVLGLATVAQSLARQSPTAWSVLSSRGMAVTFAAAPDDFVADLCEIGDFRRIRIGRRLRPASLITGTHDIRRLLRQDWDLVQVQSPVAAAIARILPSPAPLIYVAHGFHVHREGSRTSNLVYGAIERALASRASAIGLVSREDFDMAVTWGLHRRTCLWRLPGAGVDLEQFPLTAHNENGEIRLLFIGELNVNKDPMHVVEVVRYLRRAGEPVSATLVGDGVLRDAIATAAHESLGTIRWVPRTSSPERFIQDSDVLLLPSRREGLPRVVIEALATGRPVVARSNRGSRELLTAESHGQLMAPSSSTKQWAEAVLTVVRARREMRDLRESVTRFGADSFAASYRLLLDMVMTGERIHGAFDLADQEARL